MSGRIGQKTLNNDTCTDGKLAVIIKQQPVVVVVVVVEREIATAEGQVAC